MPSTVTTTWGTLAELLGTALVVAPAALGPQLRVSFSSPFELRLEVDGELVVRHVTPLQRHALMFAARRLPALYQALGEREELWLMVAGTGPVATELWQREPRRSLALDELQRRCARLDVALRPHATLGPCRSALELHRTLDAMAGFGALLEVRHEEAGVLLQRVHHARSAHAHDSSKRSGSRASSKAKGGG